MRRDFGLMLADVSLNLLERRRFHELCPHCGEGVGVLPQDLGSDLPGAVRDEPDSQEAPLAAPRRLQLRDGFVGTPDDLAGILEKHLAALRQLDLARRAEEELAAEESLERANLG